MEMEVKRMYWQSPVGLLEIEESDGCISKLAIVNPEDKKDEAESPLLKEAVKQLGEYFSGKRFDFELPLKQTGTSFQQKAWEYLLTIPYGETVSYKQEAESISTCKAVRAVGSANGKNNIAIIVPCHRVINADKKLGGYAYGLEVKKKLLIMEKEYLPNK